MLDVEEITAKDHLPRRLRRPLMAPSLLTPMITEPPPGRPASTAPPLTGLWAGWGSGQLGLCRRREPGTAKGRVLHRPMRPASSCSLGPAKDSQVRNPRKKARSSGLSALFVQVIGFR